MNRVKAGIATLGILGLLIGGVGVSYGASHSAPIYSVLTETQYGEIIYATTTMPITVSETSTDTLLSTATSTATDTSTTTAYSQMFSVFTLTQVQTLFDTVTSIGGTVTNTKTVSSTITDPVTRTVSSTATQTVSSTVTDTLRSTVTTSSTMTETRSETTTNTVSNTATSTATDTTTVTSTATDTSTVTSTETNSGGCSSGGGSYQIWLSGSDQNEQTITLCAIGGVNTHVYFSFDPSSTTAGQTEAFVTFGALSPVGLNWGLREYTSPTETTLVNFGSDVHGPTTQSFTWDSSNYYTTNWLLNLMCDGPPTCTVTLQWYVN